MLVLIKRLGTLLWLLLAALLLVATTLAAIGLFGFDPAAWLLLAAVGLLLGLMATAPGTAGDGVPVLRLWPWLVMPWLHRRPLPQRGWPLPALLALLVVNMAGDAALTEPPLGFLTDGLLYLSALVVVIGLFVDRFRPGLDGDQARLLFSALVEVQAAVALLGYTLVGALLALWPQPPFFALQLLLLVVFSWQLLVVWALLADARREGWALPRWSASVYVLMVFLPQFALTLSGDGFWETEVPLSWSEGPPPPTVDVESVYYAQAEQMASALAAVDPGEPGQPELFFIGYAPYAGEAVFRRELEQARELLAASYATGDHSLLLINHPETVERYPLANEPNLRAALAGVAAKMNPEDALLLYLTSHGSEDHQLQADFYPLRPNHLTPQAIDAALNQAQPPWALVVVSACFSGGFIEALQAPNRLVATAAAADRTSFGCGNQFRFTYYGEALLEDSLGAGLPLPEAFAHAEQLIAEREAAEELPASQPQLWIGEAIGARLEQWQPRCDRETDAAC